MLCEDGEVDMYALDAVNWPDNAKNDGDEGVGTLDMENYECMELTETRFVMHCGGDWQIPMRLVMELVDGVLTVTSATDLDGYEEGMGEDEFKKKLLS